MIEHLMKRSLSFEKIYDCITNEEALYRLGKVLEFTIKRSKLEYFDHIMRHEKHRSNKPSKEGSTEEQVQEEGGTLVANLLPIQLFGTAVNKIRIFMLIANVYN